MRAFIYCIALPGVIFLHPRKAQATITSLQTAHAARIAEHGSVLTAATAATEEVREVYAYYEVRTL